MKKRIIKIKDFARMGEIRRKISDAFSEKGAEAASALRALIDELENSEVEIDETAFAEKVMELIETYNKDNNNEVPAAVANAIANKFAAMQKAMPVSDKITPKVKNEISAAILRATNKASVEDEVKSVLVKNGISGLEFNEVVDFAINDNWGDSNELFAAFTKTRVSKFFYTTQTTTDSGVVAHGWSKSSESEKTVQGVTLSDKTIGTQYIYKRQQVAFEDLDDIERNGGATVFMRWLNDELDRQIVNTIIAKMLGATLTDITSVEVLAGATDAFRTKVIVTDDSDVTIVEARTICDSVKNPYGKQKWFICSPAQLTALAEFYYSENGTPIYRSKDEVAGQLGVDKIYVTDLATVPYCIIPEGIWVVEKNAMSVVYPHYEYNVQNYQKERNIGVGIHDLKSVAFAAES